MDLSVSVFTMGSGRLPILFDGQDFWCKGPADVSVEDLFCFLVLFNFYIFLSFTPLVVCISNVLHCLFK